MQGKLVSKVNALDASRFVLKTQYNSDKSSPKNIDNADKKIPYTRGLVIKQILMIRSLKLKIIDLALLA